jgi:2-methylcitrate dehydratase PrpD
MGVNVTTQASAADPAITETIADFALSASLASLSGDVKRESVRTVVNWIGCALGGAPTSTVDAAVKGLQSYASPGHCRVIGRRERFDAPAAAMVNCLASAAHAFDDTHLATITHPTGPVISALLAVAEAQTVSGEELLTALMIGMEIECRLSAVIVAPGAGSSGGWYITGVTGSIGAAAAVGRVLGLDRAAMVSALGLAAAQSCGTRGTHASMACAYVPAIAAQAGFTAAMLARAGFECGPAAVAGRNGVVEVIAPQADHAAICRDFGKHWEVLGNAYKPYPCGIVIHSAIDACLELARKHRPKPDEIEEVAFDVTPGALALCWRKLPNSELEAQVSLFHWLAATLIHGEATIAQAQLACIQDPRVRELQSRLTATSNPALAIDQARAVMRMRDGTTHSISIEHGVGSLVKPMSDDELSAKFLSQARGVLPDDTVAELLSASWDVRALDDVTRLLALGALVCHRRIA